MQTASGTAESDVSGVYMNMVTKSGGNRFTSDHNLYFMNDALQTTNIDDALRVRLGLQPGQQSGAAGNPIKISYDWSSTLGGPIMRDKAWFFGALRWWRLDQFQIGALNPDGTQGIDDNRIRNFMGKGTYQVNQQTRASFMFNRNLKDRFHRREVDFSEDKATVLQDQPAQNYVGQVSSVFGASTVFDARVGRMWGVFPTRYQPEVTANDIAIRDIVRNTQINAATEQSLNPNHRYQANANLGYFKENLGPADTRLQGRPAAVVGEDGLRPHPQWRPLSGAERRRGFERQIANTPVNSDHRLETWGAFVQDRWIIGRATINYGAPLRRRDVLPARPVQSRGHVRGRAVLSAQGRVRVQLQRGAAPGRVLRPVRQRPHGAQGVLRPLLQSVRVGNRREPEPQRAAEHPRDVGRSQQQSPARSGRVHRRRASPRSPAGGRPGGSAVQRRVQHRHRSSTAAQFRGVGELSPPAAPQGARHRGRRPSERGVHGGAAHVSGSGHRRADADHRVQPRPGALLRSRSRDHQRRRAGEQLRRRAVQPQQAHVQPLAAAGGPDAAVASGLLHSGTFTNPGNTTDFNDPNLPPEPGQLVGVHRAALVVHRLGSYLAAYGIQVSGKYSARAAGSADAHVPGDPAGPG